jgi:DNA repair exonuclease SbcCD ATPase subunit
MQKLFTKMKKTEDDVQRHENETRNLRTELDFGGHTDKLVATFNRNESRLTKGNQELDEEFKAFSVFAEKHEHVIGQIPEWAKRPAPKKEQKKTQEEIDEHQKELKKEQKKLQEEIESTISLFGD